MLVSLEDVAELLATAALLALVLPVYASGSYLFQLLPLDIFYRVKVALICCQERQVSRNEQYILSRS